MRLNALLSRARSWHVALLLAGALLCVGLFAQRRQALAPQTAPDGRFWYGPSQLRDTFGALSEAQRSLYARSELTVDLLFPLCYGLLLAIPLSCLHRGSRFGALPLLPLLGAVLDVVENVINAYLAWTHPNGLWAFGYVSGVCSAGKWLSIGGAVLALAAGMAARLKRRRL